MPADPTSAPYSAALDEIYRLRQAFAYEAHIATALLSYASLPKNARTQIEALRARCLRSAQGHAASEYAHLPNELRQRVMRNASMLPTLTRGQWESDHG
jgi:hypothetical protein